MPTAQAVRLHGSGSNRAGQPGTFMGNRPAERVYFLPGTLSVPAFAPPAGCHYSVQVLASPASMKGALNR